MSTQQEEIPLSETSTLNIITLDPSRLMRFTPVRAVKIARVVLKADNDVTVITAEWGEDQTFVGTYVSDEAGSLVTTLADGTVETTNTVTVGDYIVRQKNGEVQRITAAKFPTLYDVSSVSPIPNSEL